MAIGRTEFRANGRPAGAARARRAAARGLSLAELSVSLLIVSILAVALGSVMLLTSRAVALSATQAGEAKVDDAAAAIAAEQRFALGVTERTSKSITFTVADRDGDGAPEKIRYAWSGIAGDPLTRQLNGGTAVTLVPSVKWFNLSYLLASTPATPVSTVEVESAEVPLFSYETGTSASAVSTLSWVGEYFKPDWATIAPGKTVTGWCVTRVEFVAAKPVGAVGTTPWKVRLYNPAGASDWRPATASMVDEQSLPLSSMVTSSTPNWITSPVVFSVNSGLDPNRGLCLVIGPQAFSPNGTVGFNSSGAASGTAMLTSSNAGTTYNTPNTSRSLRVRVRGKYKYAG
jgi:hypothetical protein